MPSCAPRKTGGEVIEAAGTQSVELRAAILSRAGRQLRREYGEGLMIAATGAYLLRPEDATY